MYPAHSQDSPTLRASQWERTQLIILQSLGIGPLSGSVRMGEEDANVQSYRVLLY